MTLVSMTLSDPDRIARSQYFFRNQMSKTMQDRATVTIEL